MITKKPTILEQLAPFQPGYRKPKDAGAIARHLLPDIYPSKPKNRRFKPGRSPCHYCANRGQHAACRRVKLDGELCSCGCEYATQMREDYAVELDCAKREGTTPLTAEQFAKTRFDKRSPHIGTSEVNRVDAINPEQLAASFYITRTSEFYEQ